MDYIYYDGEEVYGEPVSLCHFTPPTFSRLATNSRTLLAFLSEQGQVRYRIDAPDGVTVASTTMHSGVFADGTNFCIFRYQIPSRKCSLYARVMGKRTKKREAVMQLVFNRLITDTKEGGLFTDIVWQVAYY